VIVRGFDYVGWLWFVEACLKRNDEHAEKLKKAKEEGSGKKKSEFTQKDAEYIQDHPEEAWRFITPLKEHEIDEHIRRSDLIKIRHQARKRPMTLELEKTLWDEERKAACLGKNQAMMICSMSNHLWSIYKYYQRLGYILKLKDIKKIYRINVAQGRLYPEKTPKEDHFKPPPSDYLIKLGHNKVSELIDRMVEASQN
jgi:hypothetical protein